MTEYFVENVAATSPPARLSRLRRALATKASEPEWSVTQHRREHDQGSRNLSVNPGVEFTVDVDSPVHIDVATPRHTVPQQDIVYFPGGGYVVGSPQAARPMAGHIAHACRARVHAVRYRLAPEHPFPAAIDDAFVAYQHLVDAGIRSPVLLGDSAGGGLALSLAVRIREARLPQPRGIALISAWADLGLTEIAEQATDADPLVSGSSLRWMAEMYLNGADPSTPEASPVYADLRGLPSVLLQVGGAEALKSDSLRVARKAAAAGVDVHLEEWAEMMHVWHSFAPRLPEAASALDHIAEWIDKLHR
jgi:acetyl esterase/lipase